MLCVAQIRRRKNQPLRLSHKLEEILHWTFRAPVVLGGVEIVYREGRILNLVQYSGDYNSCLLCGCGMDGLKLTIVIRKVPTVTCRQKKLSIGPHPVRVPPKTALARATYPLGTHSSGISNPCGVVFAPEKKRASKMLHSRYG